LVTAKLYYEHSINMWKRAEREVTQSVKEGQPMPVTDFSENVNMAINYNNLSVVELRQKNYQGALKSSKKALLEIEK